MSRSIGAPPERDEASPFEDAINDGLCQIRIVQDVGAGCKRFVGRDVAAVYRSARPKDYYYFDINVGGTKRVLNSAERHGSDRVVHCCVFRTNVNTDSGGS